MENYKLLKEDIFVKLKKLKKELNPKIERELDLERVARVTLKITNLTGVCDECTYLLKQINLTVDNFIEDGDIDKFNNSMKIPIKHLKREHKILREGHYMMMFATIGAASGMAFSIVTGFASVGIIYGVTMGGMIGHALDKSARIKGFEI